MDFTAAPPRSRTRPLLGNDEIARRLLQFRFDPRFRGRRRVPLAQFAQLMQTSRPTLYAWMRGDVSERHRYRLSLLLTAIDEGKLRFERQGQQWREIQRQPPDPPPPPQDKMMRAHEWNEWAQCRTCGGRVWNPVVDIANRVWMVCESCIPPEQYRWLGFA